MKSIGTFTCSGCGVTQLKYRFNQKTCSKTCQEVYTKIYHKLHYEKDIESNRETRRNYGKLFRKNNVEKRMWSSAQTRAKERELEFNIDVEDIVIPDVCPVFKVPFMVNTPYAASLDRIDSEKGYIKGNIQVISRKANLMKNDASLDELERFSNWVLN